MSTMKRIISLLLAAVMVVGMLPPAQVRASETEAAAEETLAAETAVQETSAPAETAAEVTETTAATTEAPEETEATETTAAAEETEVPETTAAPTEETEVPETTSAAEEAEVPEETIPEVSQEAAYASHASHPVCGAVCEHETAHETMSAARWTGANFSSGDYYLAYDLTISRQLTITGTVRLCLNGYTLTFAEGYGLQVQSGGSLTLCDCQGTGTIVRGPRESSSDSGILTNYGTMTIYGGDYCLDGAGVSLYNTGTLTIYDGTFGIGLSNYGTATIHQATFDLQQKTYGEAIYNAESCSLVINDCEILSYCQSMRNYGTAKIYGGTFQTTRDDSIGSDCISNYGTMYVYDAQISAAYGDGFFNDNDVTNSRAGKLYFYGGTVTSGPRHAAIYNRSTLTVSGGTLGGYIGIENGSRLTGTTDNGGTCKVSGGTISGSLCGIRNSGNTSTTYTDGVATGKKFSRGILTISGAPSISKIILEYPDAFTFQYTGTATIDLEIDTEDFAVGDTVWEYNDSKIPLMNLLNDGYVLIYSYPDGVILSSSYFGADGDNLRWDLTPEGVLTISGTGDMEDFGFSSYQPWNSSKTYIDITEIIIEPGVTSIGSAAFSYTENLTQLELPEGITAIGAWAFEGCDALEELWLPGSLTEIDRNIFTGCSAVPETIHYAGCVHQWALVTVAAQGLAFTPVCAANTNPDDGDCTTPLLCSVCGGEAAAAQEAHKAVIQNAVAATCTASGLTEGSSCSVCGEVLAVQQEVPATGHSFTDGTCTVCGALTGTCGENLTWLLEDGVLTISGTGAMEDYSFADTPWYSSRGSITSALIESGVTSIGAFAFYDCANLTDVQLPDTALTIGASAFYECTSLGSLTVPDSVTYIDEEAFNSCTGLTEVTLGSGLTTIAQNAFVSCSGLTSVTIPAGVTDLGVGPFLNCTGLTEILVDPGNPSYASDETGVLHSKDMTTLIQAPGGITGSYTVGDTVTSIGGYGFAGCTGLTEIHFPGDAPSFDISSVFYEVTATAYYPAENATWTADVMQNYGGTITWVEVCMDGHTAVSIPAVAPTCTEDGLTEGSYCSVCGLILQEQTEVAALGHDYGEWSIVTEATCTENGEDRRDCARCDHSETRVTDPTGHDYETTVTVPGCESKGYTTHTCLACGDSYVNGETSALGHDLGDWIITEATCTTDGQERRDCSRCDHYEVNVLEATGHSYEPVVTDPDCENAGFTTHLCANCGDNYVNGETAALGHAFGDWATITEATCTADGQERRDCSRCDHYETNVLKAPGHTGQTIPAVAPTCTETGLTEGKSCSVCQEVLAAQEIVEALGHDYVNYICTRCGQYAEGSGSIGEDLTWGVDTETGELTITGSGGLESPEETPWAGYEETVTDIVIGEGIISIGGGVFEDLENLETVTIPDTVETIDPDAFIGCENLTDIIVSGNNPNYADRDGVLFSKDGTELIRYPGGRQETEYTVPETVTKIHDNAFSGDGDLEALHFIGPMPEFGDDAFAGLEVTVYYPGEDPTWDSEKLLDYGGNITWVPVYDQPEVLSIEADRTTLLRGQEAKLTALLNFGGDEILWTLAEGDETWAALTADGNSAVLTAKTVEQKKTVTVTARTSGGVASAQVQIHILPQVTGVKLLDEMEQEVTGSTVWYDLNSGKTSMTVTAAVLPADALGDVTWEVNDPDGVYGTYTAAGSAFTISQPTGAFGTITVTATAADGSGCTGKLTVKFVALETEKEEIPGEDPADQNLVSGGKKTLKVYDAQTGKALTSKQITWSLDPVYEPYATITRDGKLTAKKVVKKVRIEAVGTIAGSEGTRVVVTVDIFPAVTQLQVWDEGALVSGKTIPFDLGSYGSKTLSVRLFPEDVMNVPVKWTISDGKNAFARYTVDEENNTLTIHSPTNKQGNVTLKATAQDGSKKSVTVKLKFCILTDSVTIGVKGHSEALESWEISGGQGVQLEAAVRSPVMGANPTDSKVIWSLANPEDKNYVNLSSTGKVTAKDVSVSRDVRIRAVAKDGGGAEDTFLVTVLPKDRGILTICSEGENVTKNTILVDLNSDNRTLTLSAHTFGRSEMEQVTWNPLTSRLANIQENSDGSLTVQMVSAGSQTIKATAADGRKTTVTIKALRLAASVAVSQKKTGITEGLELASGKSIDLQAVLTGTTAKKVTWAITEGSDYATVSTSGKVTAAKELTRAHTVTVTATAADGSGVQGSLTLTVRPLAQGVQVYTIENGVRTFSVRTPGRWVWSNTNLEWDLSNRSNVISLNAEVYPYYGAADDRNALQGVQWKSSAPKTADFLKDEKGNLILDEEGNVQLICHKPGSTTITVTATDGSKQKVSFKLTLVKKVTRLTLEDQRVTGGKTLNLAKLVTIEPADATNKKLTWTITSGGAYATITSGGSFKAKKVNTSKEVEVTVRSQDGGAETSCIVTIEP